MTGPANGQFTWDTNPSVRPVPAYEADGVHAGPRGFYQESYTLTCTAADGTLLGSTKVLVDKGDVANITPCISGGVGGSVPADALAHAGHSGHVRRVHAGHRQGLHGDHDRQRDLDRG